MPYKLSPSSLNLYKECPRCFYKYVNEGKKRPSGPFPSLPSGMDLAFKSYFDSFRKDGKLPPELAELKNVHLFDLEHLLKKWRNGHSGLNFKDKAGNELRGSVDEVLCTNEGDLIVLDFKTRGSKLKEDTAEHYRLQLDVYNFILRRNGFTTEDYSVLLFFYPRAFKEDGTVIFNKQLVKMSVNVNHAETMFNNAIKLLQGKKPALNYDCSFCKANIKEVLECVGNCS